MSNSDLPCVPTVALDDLGRGLATWIEGDPNPDASQPTLSVVVSRFTPDGGWSAPEVLESGIDFTAGEPTRLGMDAVGNAVVAWIDVELNGVETVEPGRTRICARSFDPGTGWDAPVTLAEQPSQWLQELGVAMEPGGEGVATWKVSRPTVGLFARRWSIAAGWGDAELVRPSTTANMYSLGSDLATNGVASVAITDAQSGVWHIFTRRAGPGHPWSTDEQVLDIERDPDRDACEVLIGMDVMKHGDLALTHFDGKTCMSFRIPSVGQLYVALPGFVWVSPTRA